MGNNVDFLCGLEYDNKPMGEFSLPGIMETGWRYPVEMCLKAENAKNWRYLF